jgi:NAD(P)-dependent dehydrogenase (short-subunit alcohol dehydrogenase family)
VPAAAETVEAITGEGGVARAFEGDMTDAEAAIAAVAEACTNGPLDVLHFNIGTSVAGGVTDTSPEDWARVFDINLGAAYHLSRAALPGMEAAGKGSLIFISSLAGLRSGPYSYVSYEASKAALQRMAQSIAREYAPKGIRANVILPGPIDTPHVTAVVAPDADPEALAKPAPPWCPWAAKAPPGTWPAPLCSSPPTTPPSSPACCCRWMGACRSRRGRSRLTPRAPDPTHPPWEPERSRSTSRRWPPTGARSTP